MKKLIGTLITATILTVVVSCSWFSNGGGGQLADAGAQVGACVLAQVESGNVDPIAVAVACAGGVLTDFVAIIENILAYYTTPAVPADAGGPPAPDGGPPKAIGATAMCGAPGAKPPYAGAPACISMGTIASLREMHAQAKAAVAAGAK